MIKRRLARLRQIIENQGLDALLISLPANRRYLSGFLPDDGQPGETSGMLLISQSAAALLTDFRYELSAREQAPLLETVIYRQNQAKEMAVLARDWGIKRLGFEAEALLVLQHQRLAAEMEGIDLISTTGLTGRLRLYKDPAEMRALRASLALMEGVLQEVLQGDLVGRTELEVARQITRAVEDAGAQGDAFAPIVAAGPSGAEPHAEPGPRVIEAGQPIIFDVGAKVDGYCSDISRSVVAGGLDQADERFKEVYAVVRRAQVAAIEGIRPGMTGSEADALAREVIKEAGYGERFGHSLGHGVGLLTHEGPSVSPNSSPKLEPGMVFTIEPGIYLPGWGGIRLEQMVELTQDGCRLLNGLEDFYDLA